MGKSQNGETACLQTKRRLHAAVKGARRQRDSKRPAAVAIGIYPDEDGFTSCQEVNKTLIVCNTVEESRKGTLQSDPGPFYSIRSISDARLLLSCHLRSQPSGMAKED